MSHLVDEAMRADMLNRLRRAEGQLRGIQRMIESDEPCVEIAGQMAAVRKALDSAYVRMAVCFMQQELSSHLSGDAQSSARLNGVLDDVQTILGKLR